MHITLHINYTEFKLIILNWRQFIRIEVIVLQINRQLNIYYCLFCRVEVESITIWVQLRVKCADSVVGEIAATWAILTVALIVLVFRNFRYLSVILYTYQYVYFPLCAIFNEKYVSFLPKNWKSLPWVRM
jgi:hypothetical protein